MTFNEIVSKTIAIHNEIPLLYNDKEIPKIVGYETGETSGYYKNGYTCYKVNGVNSKYKYYKVFIYTVSGGIVDLEEKWLIRIDSEGEYTIKGHRGWNNVDLMKYGKYSDTEDHLTEYMKKFLIRY